MVDAGRPIHPCAGAFSSGAPVHVFPAAPVALPNLTAIKLKPVRHNLIPVRGSDPSPQRFYLRRHKLGDLSRFQIDQMIMRRPVGKLEARGLSRKYMAAHKALRAERRQRAVGRRLTDAGILFQRSQLDFYRVRMVVGFNQNAHYGAALPRDPKACKAEQPVPFADVKILSHPARIAPLSQLCNLFENGSQFH
jgi:hypothetical protein